MSGKTSTASKTKYNLKAYDRLHIVVRKGLKGKIEERAERSGLSINAYINKLIENDLQS